VLHIHRFYGFRWQSYEKLRKNKRKAKHKYHFLGISPPKSRVSPFAGFRFCSNFATYSLATINFYIREIIGWRYSEVIRDDIKEISRTRLTGEYKYSITSWLPLY